MIGWLCAGRVSAVGVVLLLAVAACGDEGAADPDPFCGTYVDGQQISETLFGSGDAPIGLGVDPDEARQAVGEGRNLIDEYAAMAPDEIRTSVDVLADRTTRLFDLIEAAEFYVYQVDRAEFALSAEVVAAGDALEEWIGANCRTG
jgi:hypothetical protein